MSAEADGSEAKPYIIEDKLIDGGGSGTCIEIQNTDAYFILRNCTVFNSTHGIKLSNVTNGKLMNNHINNSFCGLDLYLSENNTLINNTAKSTSWRGFFLSESDNNVFINNTAMNNNESDGVGFYVFKSSNKTF